MIFVMIMQPDCRVIELVNHRSALSKTLNVRLVHGVCLLGNGQLLVNEKTSAK